MLIRIDLGDEIHLADVGFGGLTATAPLRLVPDVEQATPHEPFRLRTIEAATHRRLGGEYIMEAKIAGTWKALYRFDMQPAFQADYEVSNWYLSTSPKSHFIQGFTIARPREGKRYALRGNEFTTHHLDGRKERQSFNSVGELRALLEGPFGIRLPDSPEFNAALAKHLGGAS